MEVAVFGPVKTQIRNFWLFTIGKKSYTLSIEQGKILLEWDCTCTECSSVEDAYSKMGIDSEIKPCYNDRVS